MPESATNAAIEGFKKGATILDDIREKRIDVDKKEIDLKSAQDTFRRMQKLSDDMASIYPQEGESQTDYLYRAMSTAATDAMREGLPERSAVLARTAAGVVQNDAYAKSIQLQADKQTIAEIAMLAQDVDTPEKWNDFVAKVEREHPPKGEFGSIGLLRDHNGQIYPFSSERIHTLQRGLVSADKQVEMRLNEQKIRASQTQEALYRANADLARARAAAVRKGKTAKDKVGALAPKPADIKYISELAGTDYVTDDPKVKNSVQVIATEIADNIPQYMKDHGVDRHTAARALYRESKTRFAGITPQRATKGSWDSPLQMPMTADGLPDTSKLKPNTYVKAPGARYKGAILYWDGKGFSLPKAEQPAGVDSGDDSGDDSSDDDPYAPE